MQEVCKLRHLISLAIYECLFLVAGTLEALVAMAQKHLEGGVASPFLVSNYLHFDDLEVTLSVVYSPTTHFVKS